MLANGIKLGYKVKGGSGEFKVLEGLKEVPEMGVEPEMVENTALDDAVKQFEFGIGEPAELAYIFKYENKSANSPYRVMRSYADEKQIITFQQIYPDNTTFTFDAMVSVKLGSGTVNGVLDWTLKMALQGQVEIVDPA